MNSGDKIDNIDRGFLPKFFFGIFGEGKYGEYYDWIAFSPITDPDLWCLHTSKKIPLPEKIHGFIGIFPL